MLGNRIRQMRISRGLNQIELGCELNVSKQCVSNWENDNIQPSIEMLLKLADFFAVSTDYLLGLDDRQVLDVSRLTELQITHLRLLVGDLEKSE